MMGLGKGSRRGILLKPEQPYEVNQMDMGADPCHRYSKACHIPEFLCHNGLISSGIKLSRKNQTTPSRNAGCFYAKTSAWQAGGTIDPRYTVQRELYQELKKQHQETSSISKRWQSE